MNTLALVGLVALLVLIVAAKKRSRRAERRLDFSQCFHNRPHPYELDDTETCGICGRPPDDVLHKQ